MKGPELVISLMLGSGVLGGSWDGERSSEVEARRASYVQSRVVAPNGCSEKPQEGCQSSQSQPSQH